MLAMVKMPRMSQKNQKVGSQPLEMAQRRKKAHEERKKNVRKKKARLLVISNHRSGTTSMAINNRKTEM